MLLHQLFLALTALKSLENDLNAHFFCLLHIIAQPPGGQTKERQRHPVRLAQNSLPSEFRSNIPSFGATFHSKNPRTNAPYRRLRRPSIPESEPPRFARWLKN